jgi:hypothetical protein
VGFGIVSDTQLQATTGFSAPGPVDVTVTTANGTSQLTPADRFTFGFASLGGSLTSGGGPSSCAANNVNVYALGGDGVPWYKHWNAATWSAWTSVGGNVMSNPSSVCEPGTTNTHIFTEGVDNHLYHRIWNGTTFMLWEYLDGGLGSGPGSSSCVAGTINAYVLNTSGAVYWKTFTASAWGSWVLIGGHVMANPSAACEPGTSTIDLFVVGVDNALYWRQWNGATWGAWVNLGGSLTSSPAAVSCAAGTADVFVNGGDGVMWRKHWNGTTWGPWIKIGGNWTSDPGASCQPGTTKTDVFARGGDSALWWEELPS